MINVQGKNDQDAVSDKDRVSPPSITFPKPGGAIRGIGEKFSANPVTGTGSLSVPIFTTPSRSDFYPKLSLSYNSGAGNSPFGLGWDVSIPFITRKTDKGLPKYHDAEDSDTFILSGAEDLVPALVKQQDGTWKRDSFEKPADQQPYFGEQYKVQRYRPRIEGSFARIEKWTHQETGAAHWESITKDNVKSIYGKYPDGIISDIEDHTRIFKWLLQETHDDKGNAILYEYRRENENNLDRSLPQEKNRLPNGSSFANCYLKTIQYGNRTPFQLGEDLSQRQDWLFHVVFDYGEHEINHPEINGSPSLEWPVRPDAFSTYKAGFEIRIYRLCRRILMFHNFSELGDTPCLVRSTDFSYNESDPIQGPVACYLTTITHSGYVKDDQTGDYQKKSFPSLEFAYNGRTINEEIRVSDADSMENLPIGPDGARYQWVDLDGEGISGILTEQGDAWFYKRNLGNTEFGPVQILPSPPLLSAPNQGSVRFETVQLVSTKPSVANLQGGQQQFMDLAGDGQLDLVQFSDPLPGYFERGNVGDWKPFTSFASSPNVDWNDPNLRLIDLNGDGHADILISEDEVFVWYASRGEEGFGSSEIVRKPHDEEKGPVLLFDDATQSIYLADMSGDGLTDIVRIRNGEVCFWPNLGYGRFGAKVTMDGAPVFDHPDHFDHDRIRLADIDGSGTSDIIYIGTDSISIWFNQAGNSWSKPHRLSNFPPTDNLSSVSVVDLLGNGTACIVWSSPLPSANGHPMQYIDLMGGVKPHLMKAMINNMGAETRVQYASSTKFYLQDVTAETPWITRLPFPVQVLERVELRDHVSNTKLVTLYKYHHGYYDGEEREFRGFGLVEQWDTEFFDQFKSNGLFEEEPDNGDEVFHLPPVYTKTWFHTGALLDRDNISQHYVEEYYKGDSSAVLLPDTILPPGLDAKEEQEACRALKGQMLRQEIYTLDHSPKSEYPYTVTESSYKLVLVQPQQEGQYALLYSYQSEALSYRYERNPDDPRTGHAMTLEVDEFGNATKSAVIAYPRRVAEFPEQNMTFIAYTENIISNKPNESGWYRIGMPIETRTYEITGVLAPENAPYSIGAVQNAIQITSEIPYEVNADNITPQKRLIELMRSLYYKNNLSGPLPLGEVESLTLPYESYKLAFTPGLLTDVYGTRVDDDLLKEAKYIKGSDYKVQGLFPSQEQDDYWWIPSGRQIVDAAHFYLPIKFIDQFEQEFITTYDEPYFLLVIKTEDPLQNTIQAVNNYRAMLPSVITDPNGNRTEVRFDSLGMVVGTAVMGKIGETLGDSFDNFTADLTPNQIKDFFDALDPHALALQLLGTASTRIIYDLERIPVCAASIVRETHVSDLQGQETKVQLTFLYSDGFSREAQTKIRAEPGPLDLNDPNSPTIFPRWVGTGWKIYNNKGKPVRQYEPFFSPTHKFEFDKQVGESPTLFYDPLGRVIATLHPNNTYDKVVFDPWMQITWDVNDTVTQEDPKNDPDVGGFFAKLDDDEYLPAWYTFHKNSQDVAKNDAAVKAAEHENTPTFVHLDTLGRTFLTVTDNGNFGKYETNVELDIEGNQRSVTDAMDRKVMVYDYDMLGTRIHQLSVDAGERRILNNAVGKPIRTWDSRNHRIRITYDELQRPNQFFVKFEAEPGQPEILAEKTEYGEAQASPEANNLRNKIFRQFDGAGIVVNLEFDFKGNLLRGTRQLLQNYQDRVDWSLSPPLDIETFTAITMYDALNRPITLITPHNNITLPNVIQPTYNEANQLERLDVWLRQTAIPYSLLDPVTADLHPLIDIDYNAKGQRQFIEYGNGVTTTYEHDDQTFRLVHLLTTRNHGLESLQDLHYTHDPVGNITRIHDDADTQNVIFFKNQRVEPSGTYIYDALYRLLEATGREHLGQLGGLQPPAATSYTDEPRTGLLHPGDGNAMGNYAESYEYDAVGNIIKVMHSAISGTWIRNYTYAEPSLIELGKTNNRLSSTTVHPNGNQPIVEPYAHDEHGNITKMPHLAEMVWDSEDQLQMVDLIGGGKVYFVYDASGQRVRKVHEHQHENQVSTVEERIYLGGFEIYRKRSNGGIILERETLHITNDQRRIALIETKTIDIDEPAFTPETSVRYQLNNHLGSASLELDESGAMISYEEYHPYGTTSYQAGRTAAEVSLKRYRYTGKERDEETGLYYYGARYYAPWLGRWTAPDPAGLIEGPALYDYCMGNPVTFYDRNGTDRWYADPQFYAAEGYQCRAGPTPAQQYQAIAEKYKADEPSDDPTMSQLEQAREAAWAKTGVGGAPPALPSQGGAPSYEEPGMAMVAPLLVYTLEEIALAEELGVSVEIAAVLLETEHQARVARILSMVNTTGQVTAEAAEGSTAAEVGSAALRFLGMAALYAMLIFKVESDACSSCSTETLVGTNTRTFRSDAARMHPTPRLFGWQSLQSLHQWLLCCTFFGIPELLCVWFR